MPSPYATGIPNSQAGVIISPARLYYDFVGVYYTEQNVFVIVILIRGFEDFQGYLCAFPAGVLQ